MPRHSIESSDPEHRMVVYEDRFAHEHKADLLRLTPFSAVFQIFNPSVVIHSSEALEKFRVLVGDNVVYSGRAIVANQLNTGFDLTCEVTLQESPKPRATPDSLAASFPQLLKDFGKFKKVENPFKVTIADLESLFIHLRHWLEQFEEKNAPGALEKAELLRLNSELIKVAFPILDDFEALASRVPHELEALHAAYMKRHIHPLVMCSPFLYRTFQKPLGYAGDYEMVNMMLGDPCQGSNLFSKVVNGIFLNTPPVLAHRHRIRYLREVLVGEAARFIRKGRPIQVYNLGCGPAREIEYFLEDEVSNLASFTLVDFNDETLQYTRQALARKREQRDRATEFRFVRQSVTQLLKSTAAQQVRPQYDLIYCAGLFDYLHERVCKQLVQLFYRMLKPGGLIVVTNVDQSNPSRHWMEYVLDWHLIYRRASDLLELGPAQAHPEDVCVKSIEQCVNITMEVRKPPA